ncbi:hypothetical protein KDA_70100 [Dictyobacter alpinus]|uniref:Uncharacterized protein n=1 Tax=Dictyobacter alpinus TaxID=2014873 RepID=A0A402BJL8_9CHLR|nr:hypothetical protein [Dictyobacter alpinus]GCE31526.1 hypothetical protein KDA_70100 [Dictyobacter alpinus]
MKTGTVVRAHLFRERFDVMIAVIAPFIIMLESGYGNAWAFAGGQSLLTGTGLIALARGIFLEGLIFAMFKLVRLFISKNNIGFYVLALVPAVIGFVGMVVSAGCNLGFVNHSGEMAWVVKTVSQYMPDFLVVVFKLGLGLLFPIAVGAFALFDLSHLVEEMFTSSNLEDRSMIVERAEQHRSMFLKSQKKAAKTAQQHYDAACAADVDNIVKAVKSGNLSFGMDELKKEKTEKHKVGVQKIIPAQQPSLPAPSARPGLPGEFQQPRVVNAAPSQFQPLQNMTSQNVVFPSPQSMPGKPQWQAMANNQQKQ